MADPTKQYERILQAAIKRAQQQIRNIYEQSILEISFNAASITLKDKPFSLSLYPVLNQKIESMIDKMHRDIYNQIVQSVTTAWNLSNKKNDVIVDKRLSDKAPDNQKARQILYDPNKDAFNSFIARKDKGLNLSERVWNSLENYKKEMEQALGLAINRGQSATSMATEMKQYLNNPDKLFRRVRSDNGKLVLSKAARNYNPGQGVYRSSYKNALRLTATENNIAYRTADHTRWKTLPFVVGIRVHTSNNHPKYDICDALQGVYPKDFHFTGWHPNCRCYATPELMNSDQYGDLEDQILSGSRVNPPKELMVTDPPDSFTKYLSDNSDRISGWSSKPMWIKDNKKYVS